MDLRHDVLSGTIADRYQIRSVAGRGGMAIVYLAWDLRHDRAVALKLLRPEQGPSVGKARFLREIQIAAHLSHPNILAVLDSGLIDFPDGESLPFYVMPFVEDRNLAERLADPTPLPVDDALRIAAEVASALQHAHRHGIVHRDIKPANILLQDGHALVTDFGVAREFEASSITLTSAGMAIGTVQYMSPEQLSADPKLDGRADIYALGCVLFEMLAGRPPYGGSSPQETCAGHMSGIVPDMRRHVPDISPEIQAVVEQAMAKNPADRFATAADFRQALVRLQHLRGGAVLHPRVWWLRTTVAPVLIVLALAAVVLWWPRGPAGPQDWDREITRMLIPPFSADSRLQPLADAFTQALIDQLQGIPGLAVTAYDMVERYRGSDPDSLQARFPSDWRVGGTLTRRGDTTEVTARLIDPATGRQAATLSWNFVPTDGGQQVVYDSVGSFLRASLWEEHKVEVQRSQVSDEGVWQLLEQARALRAMGREAVLRLRADQLGFRSLDTADSLLAVARQRDKRSSLIPLEIARTYELRAFLTEYLQQRLGDRDRELPDPAVARAAALATVEQLLRDQPRYAAALEFRGLIRMGLYRTTGVDSLLTAATADFERATILDSRAVVAWRELSRAYLQAGRYPESMLAIDAAIRADPYRVYRARLLRGRFEIALLLQEFGRAEEECLAGRREFPNDDLFADCEVELAGRSRSDLASTRRALAVTDSIWRRDHDSLFAAQRYLWIGALLSRAGLGDSADRLARKAADLTGGVQTPSPLLVEQAILRLVRGQDDSALALIAAAVRSNPGEVPYLENAPWFTPLRQDPRFGAALSGVTPDEVRTRP